MASPLSPQSLGVLLACGAVFPIAAFLAALPGDSAKGKSINAFGVIIGVLAITVVAVVLLHYP